MITLETIGLSVGYKKGKLQSSLLNDLNLKIEPGKLVCLLGINGSGKSTLLRSIGGFQPLLSGSILLEGKDFKSLSVREKAHRIGVVLTHNYISGMMTSREVVSLGRYPHTNWWATLQKADNHKIEQAMKLTGVWDQRDAYFDELSDGQQQKIVISRVVAQDTPMIILDEPTNHLDIGNKAEILQLLQSLAHDEGKSILVSTHDLDLAMQMADEFWVIKGDKLISGSPENLLINNTLDEAFPYSGVDLFSGKVLKPATRSKAYVPGKGRNVEVTKSALRRLGFELVDDPANAQLIVQVNTDQWVLKHDGREKTADSVDELLSILASIGTE